MSRHVTTAALVRVLDTLVERGSWEIAMKIGAARSERTAFEWRAQCKKAMKENDTGSVWWLQYNGEWGWWIDFCAGCRRAHLIIAESKLRAAAVDGYTEKIFDPSGRPVYVENPDFVGRSDEYVMLAVGCEPNEVAWHRMMHTPEGHPIQAVRTVQLPAQIKRAVLAASHPDYRESLDVNVEHSGVVTVVEPLKRLASEPRAPESELRRLAAMTPEQRRLEIGASKYPKNAATGLVTHANIGAPKGDDNRPDHDGDRPQPEPKPRPAYAKIKNPGRSLDTGEGIGAGTIPPGGMKVA